MKLTYYPALMIAAAALAGCVETSTPSGGVGDPNVPLSDVDACEAAVARQTGNSQVRALSSEFSQANNSVVVGVGANAAQWRCLVKNGAVAEVMSLTNEGAL